MNTTLCELCGEPMPEGEQMFKFHGYSGPCPKPPKGRVKSGLELITEERERQISKEGWTPEHDDKHERGQMAVTAACYAVEGTSSEVRRQGKDAWPWDCCWDKRKKHSQLRRLVIAGALIAAEIDRVQRRDAKK